MKFALRTALMMMVAFVLMANTGWAKKEMRKSGFLSDYSKLEPDKGYADFGYVKEGFNWKPYDKIMIDHLVFFLSKDAEYKAIQPDELKEISDVWHRAFIESLEGAYEIVIEPGPGVLRIRAAITDLSPTKPGINTITTVLPVGLAISIFKKGATGTHAGVGQVTAEIELLDSSTNEVLAAGIDYKAGEKYRVDKMLSKWGHIRVAIEAWAKAIRERLDEVSGNK
jgi:hypothetical protein